MTAVDVLGFAAALFTTASFIPQAYKIYKTRKTEDLSIGMFSLFTVGVALWLVYGIMVLSWPVIIANAATVLLAAYILTMKLIYK
jgi:MtN3 and saliva related transmembrane protein